MSSNSSTFKPDLSTSNVHNIRKSFFRKRVSLTFSEPSLTKQASKDECDINRIMARYQKDGVLEHVARVQGQYGDFVSAPQFHDAMNSVIAAQDAFDSLPSSIRSRFGNDPAVFLDFVHDEANAPEMLKMGLLVASTSGAPGDTSPGASPSLAAKNPPLPPSDTAPEGA